MKKTWEGINTLINKKRQKRNVTSLQSPNNQRITRNQSEIANTLNRITLRPLDRSLQIVYHYPLGTLKTILGILTNPILFILMLSLPLKLKWKFLVLHQIKYMGYTLVQFVFSSPHAMLYLLL